MKRLYYSPTTLRKVSILLLSLLMLLLRQFAYSQPADAGPDVANYKGRGVRIGTRPVLIKDGYYQGFPDNDWCYVWIANPADPSFKNNKVAQPFVNPLQTTTYKLTLYHKDGNNVITQITSNEVTVYVLNAVQFAKNKDQKYGYDDGNYIKGQTKGEQWKSVEFDKFDPVDLIIVPAEAAKLVQLRTLDKDKVIVDPLVAASSPQRFDLYGANTGETSIEAFCKHPTAEDPNGEIVLDEIKVKVYIPIIKKVAIRRLHQQDDDVQLFAVITKLDKKSNRLIIDKQHPRGKPNSVVIRTTLTEEQLKKKYEMFLNKAIRYQDTGDDVIVGNTITAGPNGICDTEGLSGDEQVIKPGEGEKNAACVGAGPDAIINTGPAGNDLTSYDGLNILTGEDGICNSLVNSSQSTDFDMVKINRFLNEIAYNQAVYKWEVEPLSSIETKLDINNDRNLDISKASPELQNILEQYKSPGNEYHIFFVDNLNMIESDVAQKGFAPEGTKCVFISLTNHNVNEEYESTIAHELGHAAFDFIHPQESECGGVQGYNPLWDNFIDEKNIMSYCPGRSQFRKWQWDTINPN